MLQHLMNNQDAHPSVSSARLQFIFTSQREDCVILPKEGREGQHMLLPASVESHTSEIKSIKEHLSCETPHAIAIRGLHTCWNPARDVSFPSSCARMPLSTSRLHYMQQHMTDPIHPTVSDNTRLPPNQQVSFLIRDELPFSRTSVGSSSKLRRHLARTYALKPRHGTSHVASHGASHEEELLYAKYHALRSRP